VVGSAAPVRLAQVQTADRCTAQLHQALAQLDLNAFQGGHGARLFNHIAYVLQGLDALPALRASRSARWR
jgi:hypothetical protein